MERGRLRERERNYIKKMEALLRRMVRETQAKREREEDERLFQRHHRRTVGGPAGNGGDGMEDCVPLPGKRRYNRIINELYLRELSGPLVAEEMAKFFSPVPFGETHESAFTRLRSQRGPTDRFVSGDDQALTTSAAVHCARQGNPRQRWQRVSRRARHALKQAFRSERDTLANLEDALLGALDGAVEEYGRTTHGSSVQVELDSSYHRLLVHGLASFHYLDSETIEGADGTKAIRVRAHSRGTHGLGLGSCVDYLGQLLGAAGGKLTNPADEDGVSYS